MEEMEDISRNLIYNITVNWKEGQPSEFRNAKYVMDGRFLCIAQDKIDGMNIYKKLITINTDSVKYIAFDLIDLSDDKLQSIKNSEAFYNEQKKKWAQQMFQTGEPQQPNKQKKNEKGESYFK